MALDLLNSHKNTILKYLFTKKEDIINFENNNDIMLGDKWDTILNYPDKLYFLRRTKTNKKIIVNNVIGSLLDENTRAMNPILLIIFHNELTDYIKYNEVCEDDNEIDIILTSNNKKKLKEIREQISNTFYIYWKLLNDNRLKKFNNYYSLVKNNPIIEDIMNSLYYKVTVEELIKINKTFVETKKVRFNDLCFNLDIDERKRNDYLKNNIRSENLTNEQFIKKYEKTNI